jgi:oligopeptide/dipeptide ABC transporter ATP-binding protein
MVFQDPMTSLDPVFTVGHQIAETIVAHKKISRTEALEQAVASLRRVEIKNAEAVVRYYPHQLTGGMLQRVMIAMALSSEPQVLIADEPTTALDVTIQAQILQLIKDIQAETGMGLIMITHDLGVVAETVDRVVVMYGGKVMETGPVEAIFAAPLHPYTRALLDSIPGQVAGKRRLAEIAGASPNPAHPPAGCPFHPRCPMATIECRQVVPPLEAKAAGRQAACIHVPAEAIAA